MEPCVESKNEIDHLHFPIDAVHERLIEANVSDDVGPQAAVYCSAILQFLTSKVLQSAVKVVQMTDDQNPTKSNRKRQRNEMDQANDADTSNQPPQKKRRICPKDITRALQTDPSLKEWADLIQIPYSNKSTTNTFKSSINDCLNGVVIAFEANFDISETAYCQQLQSSLQSLQNTNGHVINNNISSLLSKQFALEPSAYCFAYLYHQSTALSQSLKYAIMSCRDDRFFIMSQSPLSMLSMAMLFANKQYIKEKDLKLYLNSHQNELFPSHYRPDITIFIEENIENLNNSDHVLTDDYFFELLIQRVASRKYGKSKFVFFDRSCIDMDNVSRCVMDIMKNKKETVNIFWDAEIRAFNQIQNPNMVDLDKRIVYSEEKQIVDGLERIKSGELQLCDIVYIHISLWMKPKKEFKRLVMAHLCRFENICFYALREHDLDERAKQIVRWIFSK